jgi:hypothetical protein
MFLFAENYFFSVENARVVLFYGRVGSYKTLSVVATAYELLKTKRYARVYANIPVTFASSPPQGTTKFDFLNEGYSKDSIFIIDEAALFLSGRSDEIKKIFAFPRKQNQIFLLASVLPVKQISDYCHLFIKREWNLSLVGFPIMSFLSGESDKSPKKEKVSHWILNYSSYFQKYSSKFRPEQIEPIEQWRDRAALYDMRSKRIPIQAVKFFVVNSWGLGEKRQDLTRGEEDLCSLYVPSFDISYVSDKSLDLPKLKKKRNFSVLGTEFRFTFFIQAILLIYAAYVFVMFIGNMTNNEPPLTKWTQVEWINFLQGNPITTKAIGLPTPTPTVTVIQWRNIK